jgi:hypothetical protein
VKIKNISPLSIKNDWFDENGDIFFIFTNEKLKTILNCHDGKFKFFICEDKKYIAIFIKPIIFD